MSTLPCKTHRTSFVAVHYTLFVYVILVLYYCNMRGIYIVYLSFNVTRRSLKVVGYLNIFEDLAGKSLPRLIFHELPVKPVTKSLTVTKCSEFELDKL